MTGWDVKFSDAMSSMPFLHNQKNTDLQVGAALAATVSPKAISSP